MPGSARVATRGGPLTPTLSSLRGARESRIGHLLRWIFAAATVLTLGCATGPQRVTKLVGGRIVVTRAVSPEAYEHVARSLLYEEEERWDDAAAELQRALPFDDEAAEVRARLAELFVRLGRLDDAAEQVERSLATVPTVDGYLARAHLAEARRDRAGMLAALRSAAAAANADEDPEAIERAHLELADAQIVALDLPAALETIRALERAAPETLRGRVQHASLSWALGQPEDGVLALEGVLSREPADIDARLLLGELQAALGNVRAAKAEFTEAIDRAESPMQIAGAVAGWLVQRGEPAEALELVERTTANVVDADSLAQASELERVVERPDRALAFAARAEKAGATAGRVAILKGEALAAKGDRAAAVKLLLGVTPDAAEHVEARLRAAELLRDDNRLVEAEAALDGAAPIGAKRDAADLQAQALAIAHSLIDEKRGDAVRAARRLDEALASDPNDARLLLSRAAVDERRGEWRRGLDATEKLIAREPRNVDALNFAGFVAADHGHDLPLATRRLQASVALSPGSGGIVDSLGWVYFRAGDLVRAAAFLEQANRLEPRDPEILGHLGDLYAKRGERARALETYRRALGLKPPERLARELTARLRALEAKSAAGR